MSEEQRIKNDIIEQLAAYKYTAVEGKSLRELRHALALCELTAEYKEIVPDSPGQGWFR